MKYYSQRHRERVQRRSKPFRSVLEALLLLSILYTVVMLAYLV